MGATARTAADNDTAILASTTNHTANTTIAITSGRIHHLVFIALTLTSIFTMEPHGRSVPVQRVTRVTDGDGRDAMLSDDVATLAAQRAPAKSSAAVVVAVKGGSEGGVAVGGGSGGAKRGHSAVDDAVEQAT